MQNQDAPTQGLNPVSVCRQFTVRVGMAMGSKWRAENGSTHAFITERGSFIMERLNPATTSSNSSLLHRPNADTPFLYRAIPVALLFFKVFLTPPRLLLALPHLLSEPWVAFWFSFVKVTVNEANKIQYIGLFIFCRNTFHSIKRTNGIYTAPDWFLKPIGDL